MLAETLAMNYDHATARTETADTHATRSLAEVLSKLSPLELISAIEDCHWDFSRLIGKIDERLAPGLASEISYLKKFEGYRSLFMFMLGHLLRVSNLAGSEGADIGCTHGIFTALIGHFGVSRTIGLDFHDHYIDTARAWSEKAGVSGLEFRKIDKGRLDIPPNSLDWILMRGKYHAIEALTANTLFREAASTLKPGGVFLFHDTVNPLNASAAETIKKYHILMELGDGTAEAPAGPIFQERVKLIARLTGASPTSEEVHKLARDTCYFDSYGIARAVEALKAGGSFKPLTFDADKVTAVPVWPTTGLPAVRPANPYAIRDELLRAGLDVSFRQSGLGPELEEHELEGYFRDNAVIYIVARKPRSGSRGAPS
jgi:SAM-dependent methyltransferase